MTTIGKETIETQSYHIQEQDITDKHYEQIQFNTNGI